MLGNGQLTRCEEHKAALLRQSEDHRRVLVTEAQSLRALAGWLDRGIAAARKVRWSWVFLAPLLPLWRKRKRGACGLVHKLAEGISLARTLTALWQRWR